MSEIVKLVGEKVISGEAENYKDVSTESLCGEGKVVGLYFSAHWCGPCRGFTPQLSSWYTKFKGGSNGPKFDIIFVSSDRSEEDFKSYFNDMPWLALPYSEREKKDQLSQKFRVSGIPTLIILDANTGEVLTKSGRSLVSEDPEGEEFPWRPKEFLDMIGDGNFVNKDDDTKSWEAIASESDILGLYFSAHWCPPCKKFTPELAKFYNKARESGKKFEVVFASSDSSEEGFKNYLSAMPWWGIPFGDKRKKALSKKFEIEGIPALLIIDIKTGEVITNNGRIYVSSDPEGKDFPWHPKPVTALDSSVAASINERPCLIWLTDGSSEQVDKAKAALDPIATPYFEQHKKEDDSVLFFYSNPNDDDIAENLVSFLGLAQTKPLVVLVNIPEQCKYVCKAKELSETAIKEFVDDYLAGTLESMTLR